MAPAEVTEDYYAVLDIAPTATSDGITKSYKRLALLRHPDRNPNSLQNAYQPLSSPIERQIYDRAHPGIRARNESTQRQAAAAQAENQRATALANSLRTLQAQLKRREDQLFESNRSLHKLEASIRQSQRLDAEDDRRENARNSWWTYLSAPIYGKVAKETEQERSLRQMDRLQRGASRRIKESEMVKQEMEVEGLLRKIDNLRLWIGIEKRKAADADDAVERARRARMQEEARERQEEERRKIEEIFFRAEVMRKQWEKEEREREDRRAEEARQRAKEATARAPTNETSVCRDQKFWIKIDGRHLCSECKTIEPRFAFTCPGCSKVACQYCRQELRGEGHRPPGRKYTFYDFYDYEAHWYEDC